MLSGRQFWILKYYVFFLTLVQKGDVTSVGYILLSYYKVFQFNQISPVSGSPCQHLLQALLLLHHWVWPSSPEGVWTSQRYDLQDLSRQPRTSYRIQPQKTVSFLFEEREREMTIWEKNKNASDLCGNELIGYIYKSGMVLWMISFCMFQDV